MKRALVTTTINDISKWLPNWTSQLTTNDAIIVVGDDKTPHKKITDALEPYMNWLYVDPRFPTDWESEKALGRNTIQRRNLGFLEAAQLGAELIISVDDDNVPVTDDWLELITKEFTRPKRVQSVSSSTGWYNPGELCLPSTVCRGFPLNQRHKPHVSHLVMEDDVRCGVFQSLVLGDPDVDAVQRIVDAPVVTGVFSSSTLAKGTWAPFNSQATVFRTELLPCMMMWPGVGRYDDIWASYLCQAVMQPFGMRVRFGHPCVRQERNAHDLVRDLELELHGYRHTSELTRMLRVISSGITLRDGKTPLSIWDVTRSTMSMLTDVMLETKDIIPQQTVTAMEAWLIDTQKVLNG